MSAFVKTLALGAAGYFAWRHFEKDRRPRNAAFDDDQPHDNHKAVRDAGPGAMRDKPRRDWSRADEASDQSFPASDPPATY